jgi:uncharacterized membrane protein YgcG
MQCEELDWIGILFTLVATGLMSILPLPKSKWLYIPLAFIKLYALMLLVANFYFILYVAQFLSEQANTWAAFWIPFIVFILASGMVWVKTYLFGLIAFFVTNSITSSYGASWSLMVSLVISVVLSFAIRKVLHTKAAEDAFMYIVNAILSVFSVLALDKGKPGSHKNQEPPNFYLICNPAYGSVTILDNIVHMALLLFYIGGMVLFRALVVHLYSMCSSKKQHRKKEEEAEDEDEKISKTDRYVYDNIPMDTRDRVVIELGTLSGGDDDDSGGGGGGGGGEGGGGDEKRKIE